MTVKFSARPRRRSARAVAGALAGVALLVSSLTACDNKSSLAFEVNGKSVSIADLDKQIAIGKSDNVVGKLAAVAPGYRQTVLTLMIQAAISDDVAKSQNVSITPAKLTAYEFQLFGGGDPQEVQASLAKEGRVYTLDQLHKLAEQFFVGTEIAKRSAGKSEQELVTEAITAAKKAAEDAAKKALAAGATYALSYVNVKDDETATSILEQVKSGAKTLEEIGKSLEPAPGQDGTASAQPLTASQSEAQMKSLLKDNFAEAKVGAYVKVGGQSGFAVLRVDKITPPTADPIPSSAELQSQAETTVSQNLTQAGQTAIVAASKKLSIWVNPRLGKLERPTDSLPSIATASPSTFDLPAADRAKLKAQQAAEQAAQQAAQQQSGG